jgi:hypothetical protein
MVALRRALETGDVVRTPDLFIAGAPKCGTTALHHYLSEHPRIFMSTAKEPWYFASDYPRLRSTLEDYLQVFRGATENHLAVGEASAVYLRSSVALPAIREFRPDARIVAMVRNPVDLAYSFHSQQLSSLNEDETDFERAWRLQEARRKGDSIPRLCRTPPLLQYGEVARVGEQVQRLLSIFDERQVKIVVFDDLVADTRTVYEEVLTFLGVPSDERSGFPRMNVNQHHRSALIARLSRRPPRWLLGPYLSLKRRVGWGDLGFGGWIKRVNARPVTRPPLPVDFRRELIEEFRGDVDLLAGILDRDLSHWQRPPDGDLG